MKVRQKSRSSMSTYYITIDTKFCEACWKCIDVCKNEVLGNIDIFFHKHVKIKQPDKCTGCAKCIKICEHGAIANLKRVNEHMI